jgi:hypothetical protein
VNPHPWVEAPGPRQAHNAAMWRRVLVVVLVLYVAWGFVWSVIDAVQQGWVEGAVVPVLFGLSV